MRKIIISAGHSNGKGITRDMGASGNGLIEGLETIWLRDEICKELDKYKVSYLKDKDEHALSQTLSWLRGLFSSKDILIDIHFNSFPDTSSNGTEIFIPNNATQFEKNLAGVLLKDLVTVGSFKNRGLKTPAQSGRGVLGWFRPNAEQCLLEVCFLSNKLDVALWKANKNNIAKAIAKTLAEYVKK